MAFLTKVSFRRVAESIFGVSYIQAGEGECKMRPWLVRMDYKNKKRKVRRHDQLHGVP